jgi:peptidoglycan LD-endopeptidase CwlK
MPEPTFTLTAAAAAKLATCDPRLIALVDTVASRFPCTVITGHRTREEQTAAVAAGRSKTPWPKSRHNSLPSRAVDLAPTPIDWTDRERFTLFAGFVLGTAAAQGVRVRWGGDWDGDRDVKDNSFDDLVHFELLN